ncbi:MAG: exonuclease subunit SbcD [Myxococcales bacterium]|nr:exonuclease subunit SbcD [Myxococcales bacterium]MCB9520128.1 exonuclease subunit SbcD [Myxococcales bacterium]MCB9531251.1 exonuclease subunit SbcD [Myxococcales bacterium]
MRILHTSDWHLGATLNQASRDDEHARFLSWLVDTVQTEAVDVLVVAGDVFHHLQPSAEALSLYYGALAELRRRTSLSKVVVVGGNHDSSVRLDAPRAVLGALDVTVIGGYTSTDPIDRFVCVVPDRDRGGVGLVVGALPYVHEYKLGVRSIGRSDADLRFDLRREFARLYTRLADACAAVANGAPLMATGHLTCVGVDEGDFGTALHQSKSVGGFEADIFDRRFSYVALGHIHRAMDVHAGRVWYSGTPVPVTRGEARTPRVVLCVDIEPGAPPRVRPIEVPTFRRIVTFEGRIDEVVRGLRDLSWEQDLEPYVTAIVTVDESDAGTARQLHDTLAKLPEDRRPRLLHVEARRAPVEAVDSGNRKTRRASRPLAKMHPEEVFVRLHTVRHGSPPPQELLVAFRELLVEDA